MVADGATSGLSEYEAKRLRRIEENRQKLRELNLPTIPTPQVCSVNHSHKKRKREAEQDDIKPLKPVRKSRRQRKKRRLEKEKRKLEKIVVKEEMKARRRNDKQREKEMKRLLKRQKLEKKLKKEIHEVEKEERRRRKEEKLLDAEERLRQEEKWDVEDKEVEKYQEKEENHVETEMWQLPQILEQEQPRISDWRLRRKLQAREERRVEVMKRQEVQRQKRLREKIRTRREQLQERAIRKNEKEKRKLEKQRLKLLRRQERKMMRLEDRMARALRKQEHSEARRRWLAEKQAARDRQVDEVQAEQKKIERAEEWNLLETWNKMRYPVQQLDWPFIRISDGIHADETKPRVLTPLLKVDVDRFHFFSLGKQFLPPGRQTVMQALCPGGYTAVFDDATDVHDWKNAMTLFVSSTTDIFYRSLFEEKMIDDRKHVFFRWDRFRQDSPEIRSRMSQIRRGERQICFDEDTYNIPTRSATPEPLLLFIQYPNGPSIYCGRLGYLGHKADEFAFELLDARSPAPSVPVQCYHHYRCNYHSAPRQALNWDKIHSLIKNC